METKTAYGETKAPADVDTLRDQECPVCGESDAYDGDRCQVCGFIKPPAMFLDPDLDLAKQVDLRKQVSDDLTDPNDLNQDGIPDQTPGQANFPDPTALGGDVQQDPANLGAGPGNGDPTAVQDALDGQVPGDANSSDDPQGSAFDVEENAPASGDPAQDDPEAAQGTEQQDGDLTDPEELPGVADDGQAEVGAPTDGQLLACPNCGFQAQATPPTTSVTDPGDDPAADGVAEGDVCPNCMQAALMGQDDLVAATGGVPVG